jgi:hypothetical protein
MANAPLRGGSADWRVLGRSLILMSLGALSQLAHADDVVKPKQAATPPAADAPADGCTGDDVVSQIQQPVAHGHGGLVHVASAHSERE